MIIFIGILGFVCGWIVSYIQNNPKYGKDVK